MCVCVCVRVCVCLYVSVLYIFTLVTAVLGSDKKAVKVCEVAILFFCLTLIRIFSHALLILASDNLLCGCLRH